MADKGGRRAVEGDGRWEMTLVIREGAEVMMMMVMGDEEVGVIGSMMRRERKGDGQLGRDKGRYRERSIDR